MALWRSGSSRRSGPSTPEPGPALRSHHSFVSGLGRSIAPRTAEQALQLHAEAQQAMERLGDLDVQVHIDPHHFAVVASSALTFSRRGC